MPNSFRPAALDLPPFPVDLVNKANAFYSYLMYSTDPLGKKLHAVYCFIDALAPYVAEFVCCSKGCSHCCCIDVQLTSLEAEYIHLSTGAPLRHPGPLSTGHRDPCHFLDDAGVCGIYAARPITCRILHAVGEPAKCMAGNKQIYYGHPPDFGNAIYANLINWLHSVTVDGGGLGGDIRDFFPVGAALPKSY